MIQQLRHAHERRDRGGLEPGDHVGDIGRAEAGVLHVDHHKIHAGHLQHLRNAARAEFQHHMAHWHAAFGAHLLEAVWFQFLLL